MRIPAICLLFVLAFSPLPANASEDKDKLVGVWTYVKETDTRSDGSPAPTQALSEGEGLLIYTADGFMSVTIMPKNRNWSAETATIGELRETVSNGTAYAGRYEVDTAAHTVTHINAVNLEPGYKGRRLVRNYVLDGDTLQLSGTFPYQGEDIRFVITWARVKGAK